MTSVRLRVTLSAVLAAALGASAAVPAVAGPGPDFDWGWVTIRTPASAVALAARDRGNSTGGVNTYFYDGPGEWRVTFPGLSPAANAMFVTPWRTDRWCSTGYQNGTGGNTEVKVVCVDENGVQKNTRFSLVVVNGNVGSDPFGHFWAGHPGTSPYTVDAFYSYNSAGALNKVKVLGTGRWKVRFNDLGAGGGMLHLSPIAWNWLAPTPIACQVEGWGRNAGGDLLGTVACYDETGAPFDAKFYAAYMRGVGFKGDGGTRVAYAFAKQPSTASYTPPSGRSYNSTGDPILIERDSTGVYRVEFGGQGKGGAAVVTAYGTNGNRCAITSIRVNATPQRVKVACVDPNGNPDDTKFLVSWVK